MGGGLLENVFLIFLFPSASVDRTSFCAAFFRSQRQQAERSVKFSSFSLSFTLYLPQPCLFLKAWICFMAFPSSSHAITVIFPPFSLLFSLLSFTGSSLAFGLCLPFSLPHFLCALQWFFRFFPAYNFPIPNHFHPNVCFCTLSPVETQYLGN